MEKEVILFDWDDTLFSKVEYKKNLRGNLARICEVSEDEILKVENNYFDGLVKSDDFQIENFVNTFEQKFGKKVDLEDFDSNKLKIYSGALFSETISVLENLQKNFNLGIYSQGFIGLQKIKIESSGIKNFFNSNYIYIDRNKISQDFVNKLPDETIIIDDKKEVIEILKKTGRFKLIWINRIDDQKIDGIKTIKNLSELLNLELR